MGGGGQWNQIAIERDGNLEKEEECIKSEVTSHKFFDLALFSENQVIFIHTPPFTQSDIKIDQRRNRIKT